MGDKIPLSQAIPVLNKNLSEIGRVKEWAVHMGYKRSKTFSRYFLRYYNVRPQVVINKVRLKSIVNHLKEEDSLSNFDIAVRHSLPDEKALNNFINYHLGCSPTEIKTLPHTTINKELEIFSSEIGE